MDRASETVLEINEAGQVYSTLSGNILASIDADQTGHIYRLDVAGVFRFLPSFSTGTGTVMLEGLEAGSKLATDAKGNVYFFEPSGAISMANPLGGYYLDKELPTGLNFDGQTGSISGTPLQTAALQTFTVTAHNNAGVTTDTFDMKVISDDPTISAITVSNGSTTYPITYQGASYPTTAVENSVSSVNVVISTTDPTASVTICPPFPF
ncbi:MAG: hypothetical protein EOP49_48535, partial [Sphingobacteriales bacterium]